jgi:predicted enzyme related to lactoylglutathione lyase
LSKINLLFLSLAVFIGGCAGISVDLPPITDAPTGERHNGKIVWHDLLTNTPEASRRFYGEMFGWAFEKPSTVLGFGGDDTYMLIRHEGRLIGGMLDTNAFREGENVSQWITTASVDDIDAAVERVTAQGGKIETPPTAVGSRGRMAVVEDSTGARFAMIESSGGDPAHSEPVYNGWLWDEVWTDDVERATSFYQAVMGFDYTDHDIDDSDRNYRVLSMGDQPRAGVMEMPFEDVRPVWVNYIRVKNPAALTARAQELGGKVLVEAREREIGGIVALVAGPSGAGIALQTWPTNSGEADE